MSGADTITELLLSQRAYRYGGDTLGAVIVATIRDRRQALRQGAGSQP
jgi:hypothetical protein